MRSTVLPPIEPVAPSSVTLRTALAGLARTEDVFTDIQSPYEKPARRRIEPAAHNANKRRRDHRGQIAIEPIHQPAMPRQDAAGILGVEVALERGFDQVTSLGNHRKYERDQGDGAK